MANEHYVNEFYDNAARAEVGAALVNKKANVCPFAVRLAWHASGTFDSGDSHSPGGSNGATMRFAPESTDGANAGLGIMRDILAPVQTKFPKLSIADLWTMAGTQAIRLTGGPVVDFRYGRTDAVNENANATCCPANGRLPDAAQGATHLREVFGRMGFDDKAIVALSGAHTLGSCHATRSGYDGPWTSHPLKFDNEYFVNLLNKTWTKRDWDGPEQFQDESGSLMMLPTDMCLLDDPGFLPHVQAYAADEQLFFADFADAFAKLLSKGCPASCQPGAPIPPADASTPNQEFRDLAMHGSVARMKALLQTEPAVDANSAEPLSGRTAAHKAAFFGHANVMAYLASVDVGANLNAVDDDGDTPLHDAAKLGHDKVVEELLKAKVDTSVRNNDGRLALDLATAGGKDAVAKLLQ